MERKDNFFLAELVFSFLMLNLMALVFMGALEEFHLYLSAGLLAGFTFSWVTRAKQYPAARIAVNITAVAVCVWILFNVLNSSFYYTEVILIFLKGGILLEIVLSFDSYTRGSLAYLQALSLPLLMCFPLFVKQYTLVHLFVALSYIICWGAIFKIRFYESFKPVALKASARKYGLVFGLAVFLAAAFASQVFLKHLSLGTMEKRGFLVADGKTIKMKEDTAEKEYYALQDKLQAEIMKLLPDMQNQKDRQEVLYLLSSLIKDSQNVLETKKAHQGLVDFFQRPGPGLEHVDTQNMSILLNEYMDKKSQVQTKRARDSMVAKAKNNPFNIWEKLSLADKANKMRQEQSFQKVQEGQRQVNEITDAAGVGPQVKSEMKDSARNMKALKALQFYIEQKRSLASRPGSSRGRMQELAAKIEKMEKQPEFTEAEELLDLIEKSEDPREKEGAEGLGLMLNLKEEIVLQGRAEALKEKIAQMQLTPRAIRRMQELLDKAQDAATAQALSENALELQQAARQEQAPMGEGLKELLLVKMHILLKQIREETKKALSENTLPDKGKELEEGVDRIQLHKEPQEALAEIQKIRNQVERIRKESYISNRTAEAVFKNLEQMQEVFILKSKLQTQSAPEPEKEKDYRQELRDRIDSSTLGDRNKETLHQFANSVFKAESLNQLENIAQALKQEFASQVKEGESKQEVQKLQDAFNKAIQIQKMLIADSMLAEMLQKVQELQKTDPEAAEKLKEMIESIRNSSSVQEMQEKIEKLKEHLQELAEKAREQPREEEKKKTPWEIFILPSRIVISPGASFSPKVIGIFNRIFIRELSAELEWSSSNPEVATVDSRGVIKAQNKGTSRITVRYRGEDGSGAEIIVVDKTHEALAIAVKKEIMR